MSAAELARQIDVPTNRVTQILNGTRAIIGETALRLAHFFCTSAQFWLNLESLYHPRLAQEKAGKSINERGLFMAITKNLAALATTSIALALGGTRAAQKTAEPSLPYTAIHDPQFIPASSATFLHDPDRVIGITAGTIAKAYPAAILSQHGLVEDQSPSGPIAVTW